MVVDVDEDLLRALEENHGKGQMKNPPFFSLGINS